MQCQFLEKGHPDILITRNCIANTLQCQNRIVSAHKIYQEDFDKRLTIYGAKHHEIVDTVGKLNQIKLAINLEMSNVHTTIYKRYGNIAKVSHKRHNTVENALDFDKADDFPSSSHIHKVDKVISNLLEDDFFFDQDISFAHFQQQQSNESYHQDMNEYVERKRFEEINDGFVLNEDSIWNLLKFVKMFNEEKTRGGSKEDLTVFSFLKLINDLQKEKKFRHI